MRVVITGAGSGIGAACAFNLATAGWEVVATDLTPASGVIELDVASESAWDDVLAEVGPIDGLVTCAGIRRGSSIVDTSLDEWRRLVRHVAQRLSAVARRASLREETAGRVRGRTPIAKDAGASTGCGWGAAGVVARGVVGAGAGEFGPHPLESIAPLSVTGGGSGGCDEVQRRSGKLRADVLL